MEIFGNILDAMGGGGGGTDTELDDIIGNDSTKPITYKHIDELRYCDAVIKKVYRHFPVAFSLGHVSAEKKRNDKYLLEKQHVKTAFLIFGGGIGACPGRKLAMVKLNCLLASIL
ncbi:hypothetical protein RhiirA4_459699 [Rhizophagus irregularis]|uniref:Cytochrome P450 n=1 Tax=Rhizophagus irregularis TaxID=588596 RepID=A0A2I1GEY1_9GLOM|nr:hypothetical protein RhiirA4_459699 [Rhizophagus irregularis]